MDTMTLKATGSTALIMASGALADPGNYYARKIAEITDKGAKMTEEDRRQKSLLQWRGHLYEEDGQIIIPAANLIRCLQRAGTAFRLGTAAQRGIFVPVTSIPLAYQGSPADIGGMVMDAKFTWEAVCNLNPTKGQRGGKGTKVWPRFLPWAFTVELLVDPEMISADDVRRVVRAAGSAEGIGDARRLGYGRFNVELS